MDKYDWSNQQTLASRSYTCGYCNRPLASEKGWSGPLVGHQHVKGFIYVCHNCSGPTVFEHHGRQLPAVTFGHPVNDIPEPTVTALYEEARKATGSGAYTAAVLCCRKLLMHIAVAKGAQPGQNFASYVDHLSTNHFISPDAKDGSITFVRKATKPITRSR